MHIVFLDYTPWDYHAASPYEIPLGGSQSALCYLAEALANLGHAVEILNGTCREHFTRGVQTRPLAEALPACLRRADAVVLLNLARPAAELKSQLPPGRPLVFWSQHAADQPAVQDLRDERSRTAIDGFALVSDWQRGQFLETFGLLPERCHVLRNAIGPPFRGLFPDARTALAGKAKPPVLAYTSTPFRGLDVLLELFPRIRAAWPEVRLQVFSSMRVYQMTTEADQARYGKLYQRCRETEGVDYFGSLPQPELAAALARATVLAYPNHFAETSCIAVLEALAAGCRVVTSDLAALPETCQGFGQLIAVEHASISYAKRFVHAVLDVLAESQQPQVALPNLGRQLAAIEQASTWPLKAAHWVEWLTELGA